MLRIALIKYSAYLVRLMTVSTKRDYKKTLRNWNVAIYMFPLFIAVEIRRIKLGIQQNINNNLGTSLDFTTIIIIIPKIVPDKNKSKIRILSTTCIAYGGVRTIHILKINNM